MYPLLLLHQFLVEILNSNFFISFQLKYFLKLSSAIPPQLDAARRTESLNKKVVFRMYSEQDGLPKVIFIRNVLYSSLSCKRNRIMEDRRSPFLNDDVSPVRITFYLFSNVSTLKI